ncbi:DNA polymerase-4 [Brassicibacter mesophilus]
MDAFYASVEEHDNPKLKGHPVIVGGSSNHGVVTTANYAARKYGVRSAMPIFIAKKRCPNAYFLPVRMKRYQEVSREVFDILYEITDIIEPLSIDEAYLDISYTGIHPLNIAKLIKQNVKTNTGLTISVGISYNKFLAKLASDWNKPNGIKIITKDMIPDILLPLSITSVYGIGKQSAKKLNNIGIYTIEDLMRLSEDFLIDFLGKIGSEIYNRIRGTDSRKVNVTRERKSIGAERTLSSNTKDIDLIKKYLHDFSFDLETSLKHKNMQAKTVTIKIKDKDFKVHTKSRTLNDYILYSNQIYETAIDLLSEIHFDKSIRLIGLTVSNLYPLGIEQLSMFD